MQISVLGLGYVGAVAAACLADSGNNVVVVDINQEKVSQLNAGQSPIMESGLAELIERNVTQRRLSATDDLPQAVLNSEATIICVGTPSSLCGDVRLTDLDRVVDQVAETLRDSASWHLVMLTSTVPPGTTEQRVIPRLEEISGCRCGQDFGVAFSPEFLCPVAQCLGPPHRPRAAGADRTDHRTALAARFCRSTAHLGVHALRHFCRRSSR